jgi:hypothetical protein
VAVLVATRIVKGSQVDVDQLSQRVEEAIAQQGAPPMGLMVHIAHPAGDGFVIQDVWRTEAEMRSYYDSVVLPALTATGLTHEEPCRSGLVFRTSVTAARRSRTYSCDPYTLRQPIPRRVRRGGTGVCRPGNRGLSHFP